MLKRNRVVVTGLGVLAANGNGIHNFWETLVDGKSGIGPITRFNAENFPSRVAGEVKEFDPEKFLKGRVKPKRLSRNTQFAIAAATLALEDARLYKHTLEKAAPVVIFLGISLGGFDLIEDQMQRLINKGPNSVLPTVLASIHLAAASLISEMIEVPTKIGTYSNTCVGGMDAIAQASMMIRQGYADIAIAGGSDAPLVASAIAGFCSADMLTTSNDHPETASRPFDLHRDGGVIAEGSGVVILENAAHAAARGAEAYLEITGFGNARDPAGEEAGFGFADSMEQAIANAGLLKDDITYICAHGPSDVVIDRVETEAIKKVFGRSAYEKPASSIKGVTGNPLAAAGPLQMIACALAMRHGRIPPTANYKTPDPQCDLDYVPNKSRRAVLKNVLINCHGSGSVNSSMTVRSCEAS